MYSKEEFVSVHGFVKSTNEGNLKKMLVGAKFTEAQFRIFLKIARACNETEFTDHATAGTFPKIKLNAQEVALKEGIWNASFEALAAVGLLTKGKAA